MVLIAINWSAILLQAGQLLLALSILVILHEFGHFITAKWFGCRVEKFYLFLIHGFRVEKEDW
jgi:regulator of sigma E protease